MIRFQVALLLIAVAIMAFGAWTAFVVGNNAGIVLLAGGATISALSATLGKKKDGRNAG